MGQSPTASGGFAEDSWGDVLSAVDRTHAELVAYQERLERRNEALHEPRRGSRARWPTCGSRVRPRLSRPIWSHPRTRSLSTSRCRRGCRIGGAPGHVQQIVMHLAQNAMDALKGHAASELVMRVATEGGRAQLTLSDNGPGVPQEVRAAIFDPFFTWGRAPASASPSAPRSRRSMAQETLIALRELGEAREVLEQMAEGDRALAGVRAGKVSA